MAASNLSQLNLVVTNQEWDVVFGCIFDVRQLLTRATEHDVMRRDPKAPHQIQLMLKDKQDISIRNCLKQFKKHKYRIRQLFLDAEHSDS